MIRKILSYSLRLLLICGVSGIGVSLTFNVVRGKIERNKADAFAAALQEVSGGEALEKFTAPVNGKDKDFWKGKNDLYINVGEAQGYSSKLRVLVGVRMENPEEPVLQAIKILYQQETPGLGARVEEVESKDTIWSLIFGSQSDKTEEEKTPWFQAQFRDKKLSAVEKALGGDPSELGRHITGATITSNAVEKTITNAVENIRQVISKRP